ncbi:MAG TPA: Imm1 family immunity protein [Pseudonocardiaceae bacterium]
MTGILARYWVHAYDHPPKESLTEFSTPEQVRAFVTLLATDAHVSDAVLVHTGRPRWETKIPDDEHPGSFLTVPDHWAIVGVRGQRGAMCYTGDDGCGPEPVDLYSLGRGPDDEQLFETHRFPPDCELPIEDITEALVEFLETAKRPLSIPWQKRRDAA